MSLLAMRELREKTTAELEEELRSLKQQSFGIRVKMPTQEGENPYLLRTYRRRTARILTVLNERARSAAPELETESTRKEEN